MYLAQGMNYLPSNIQELKLYLGLNKLGENPDNIKNLGFIMKQLPNKLKSLTFGLTFNNLGDNSENIK